MSSPETPPAERRGSVLFIDDEPQLGELVACALQPDLDVTAVTTGAEALRRIAGGERFDVIFCDLMMPVMNGAELYAELERVAPELCPRVVFISGGAVSPDTQALLARVPNPQMRKPFDLDQLASLIAVRLGR